MPVLFVGHGNPMNAVSDNAFTRNLKKTGSFIKEKYKPVALMLVSAHWLTRGTYVCTNPQPDIIYDFGGFPDELYRVVYPAKGSTVMAEFTASLESSIIKTDKWGLDHGAWTILKHLFPDADVPVYQLSIDYFNTMAYHYGLGTRLKSLRDKGALVIGSGNIVHAIRTEPKDEPYDWAVEFDEWVKEKIIERDFDSLVNYKNFGKSADLSVPTVDHFAPLLYSLSLSEPEDKISFIYESIELGILSMRSLIIE